MLAEDAMKELDDIYCDLTLDDAATIRRIGVLLGIYFGRIAS